MESIGDVTNRSQRVGAIGQHNSINEQSYFNTIRDKEQPSESIGTIEVTSLAAQ